MSDDRTCARCGATLVGLVARDEETGKLICRACHGKEENKDEQPRREAD